VHLLEDDMKVLWTLFKVGLALLVLIPVGLIALGLAGAVFGLAFVALRLALIGLLALGAIKLVARLIRGPAKPIPVKETPQLSSADPYYQSALRELDRDLA
jgi:hypothetical protein